MKRGKVFAFLAMAFIGGLGLIVYSCGPQPVDLNITQDNNAPPGSVQGEVRNFNTGELLANAEIKAQVRGGWVTTKTDSQGKYNLAGLPANNTYNMYASLDGFGIAIYSVVIPTTWAAGGNYPVFKSGIVIQDIDLRQADASLQINVTRTTNCGTCTGYVAPNPLSHAGATVSVDLTNNGYDYAQTKSLGSATYGIFTELPAPTSWVAPNNIIKATPIDCGNGYFLVGATITSPATVALYNGAKSTAWLNYPACFTP